jgi:hypothetical protein
VSRPGLCRVARRAPDVQRHGECRASCDAELSKTDGDQGLLAVDDVDHQVGAAKVLVECQPLAFGERVVGRHHADADVLEEEFVTERCGWIGNVEAQIESPAQDVVEHSVASRLDSKRGMRRELGDLASDLMKEHEQRVIGRREAVVLLRGRRVEDLGGGQRLQLGHQTGELPLDALCPRGQDVAAAVANEELVVEQPAKSGERAAWVHP